MKVRDVMRVQVAFCSLDTTLAAAIKLMQANSCGFLPVIGEGGNVIGVITDRDMAIALGTRDRKPADVLAREVILPGRYTCPKLFTCAPDDDIHCVLKTMRSARVRRLPVIDHEGTLVGILSLDDITLRACRLATKQEISCKDVVEAYKAILVPCHCRETRRPVAA